MRCQHGMTFLVVLIFLQIITLLGLYALEISGREIKLSHSAWQQYLEHALAEQALEKIEANPSSACFISPTTTQFLKQQPLSWWQLGCSNSIKNLHYYYVIELLHQNSCVYFQNAIGLVNYYRITLYGLFEPTGRSLQLQSLLILPSKDSVSGCQEVRERVTIGRQMWREII